MTVEEQLRALARHADEHQQVITAAEIRQRAGHGFGQFTTRSPSNGYPVLADMPVQFTEPEAFVLEAPSANDEPPAGPRRLVMAGLLAAAAVVAIALLPILRDDAGSPADHPPTTITVPPTVPPRALFVTADERFAPGTYSVDQVAGSPTPQILVTVGEGWRNSLDEGAIRNDDIGGVITFSSPVAVFADACHADDGVYPGPITSLDGLVAALSEQGGWLDVTAPSDISVDGYPGKTFQRTAPASFAGCTSGGDTGFRSFDNGGRAGGWEFYERGEIETVRVFDVNGSIIMLTAKLKTGHQDAAAVDGLAAVFDSIRIEQA